MVSIASVRDYIKALGVIKTAYIGRIDANKTNVLGVYNRQQAATKHAAIGNIKTYDCTPVSLLIHGNDSKGQTEALAQKLYTALEQAQGGVIGGKSVYFIELLYDAPVDVDQDANSIYEYVIDANIYTER